MIKCAVMALLLTSLVSCGGSSNSYKDSYDFTVNGCSTGKQSFSASSQEALLDKVCEALVDEELNNGCAASLRAQKFNAQCSEVELSNF